MKFLGLFPVVAISSSLALSGVQQAMASDDRPPADFLLEMIDPSLCLVPPADMSDAEIIAMLDSDDPEDRKSTRLNSSHVRISYAVFCLKKKKTKLTTQVQG